MDKKNRTSLKDRHLYYWDLFLSKGTFSTILILFCVTGISVILLAVLAVVFGGENLSLGESLWGTLNHTQVKTVSS